MTTKLSLPERFQRLATLKLVIALVAGIGASVLAHAPLLITVGAAFAIPLVFAVLVFGWRWVAAALSGRRRMPTPPRRAGSTQPRPFSPAQRRRPRT